MTVKRFWAYLWFVIRHKYFVWKAGRVIGASVWRLLVHDWTKLLPVEFGPYARTFYGIDGGSKKYEESDEFLKAWLHHQNHNDHHWNYWVIRMDRGDEIALEMPLECVLEMVADWAGAGKAIAGKWGNIHQWYYKNKSRIKLHERSRRQAELIMLTNLTSLEREDNK